MTVIIIDENGKREYDAEHEVEMCIECHTTNEGWRKRCKNCGKKLSGLTYKQEDYIIENGR